MNRGLFDPPAPAVDLDAEIASMRPTVYTEVRFDGPEYAPGLDRERLVTQLERVRRAILRGGWYTLAELEAETGEPPASISAQLRHLRKPRFGEYVIEKRRRGDPSDGLYEYRLAGRRRP